MSSGGTDPAEVVSVAGGGPGDEGTRTVAVVGPTATGKSDLGLALAGLFDGEVVNADASQFYRGMDIGTAKLPAEQRHGIPHHQLDVLTVTQEASVAAYQQAGRADLAGIRKRGRVPVVVGGSGLYVRALLDRLEIPPTDPRVRAWWEERLEVEGAQPLHDRLVELDPAAAAAIEPRNGRRIVRALEVIELTGRPFSATLPSREFVEPAVLIGLRAPREVLDARIEQRAAGMWRAGLVEEVRTLQGEGLRNGRTASRAVGYAQALRQLDGELTQDEAVAETVVATRRLARRQERWFGADPRVVWLEHDDPDLVDRALDVVRQAEDA
ncbi:tRNA (adenosine(37)-N6)-dimethylallyltransferase MiaA [Ornithinimicrobium pratense]|uniref:tRNA dimethylallyltransferase n=1 Tax=Ornithinimicrobium pratense TaxID=2593973 RepID=A0A5J6V2Y6_9MICO|nr:tRNA (adenosine(37)-N6)-dimethylallyltransferase MiaA [Ornithinimicrobium pratense]QFG68037.1 tRNA (adenosine(37)-N6)-dimethylallyltransferase MiaA [Ornithinimicrobium pratense]